MTEKFKQNVNYQSCKTYREFVLDTKNQKIRKCYEVNDFYAGTKYEGKHSFDYNYDALPMNLPGK